MAVTRPTTRLPMIMTIREAEAIAGALGHPSKMPGFSYGISAQKCITGGTLRGVRGSVCSGCYAMTDWYRSWRPLLQGHERRWRGIHHERWVDAMVTLISAKCRDPEHRWFRWHDSGDLQGVWHLSRIVQICQRTPDVRHWLPTREYGFVAEFLAGGRALPDNLVVRLSGMMIDAEPVVPPAIAHLPTSTVASVPFSSSGVRIIDRKGALECRAVETRDNKCGECRACWDARVTNVTYPQH